MLRLGLILAVLLSAEGAEAQDSKMIDQGHRLVQANCSRCHSVEISGSSPLPKAPPFRTLHERYPIEDLAEALAEGIVTAHEAMPQFEFDPEQIDAIIAYLKTL